MKERLESIARDIIKLSLTEGLSTKQLALLTVTRLDEISDRIEREFLDYGE